MKISVFDRSAKAENRPPDYFIEDWEDLVDLLTDVQEGAKDGKHFVRGFCNGPRDDSNMESIDVIVIDGDSKIDNAESCCQPSLVHESLKKRDIRHVIHTSYSNDVVLNKHKWRAIIPCSNIVGKESLAQAVREIIAILHEDSLLVRNVSENSTVSQAWYTPRCHVGLSDDFYCAYHDGEVYQITGVQTVANDLFLPTKDRADGSIFSWDDVVTLFKAGTLHQGLKSAAGFLVYTTSFSKSQITSLLSAMVDICPDKEKVKRAKDGEISKLVEYCQKKEGLNPVDVGWRDYYGNLSTLKDKEFPPVEWAVDGLIPEGLTILAGESKVGKSLWALDICRSIASGQQTLGGVDCVEGASFYCCLEDPESLIQERNSRQDNETWPEKFHYTTDGVNPENLLNLLDEWLNTFPNLRCVVIDVLEKILPDVKSGSQKDYSYYYKVLPPIQKWANINKIAVIGVHHSNKGTMVEGANPFDKIMGSQAIQSNSDMMIMMFRNHAKIASGGKVNQNGAPLCDGFLYTKGRRVADEKFLIDFDDAHLTWILREKSKEEDLSGVTNKMIILETLKKSSMQGTTVNELYSEINNGGEEIISIGTIKGTLSRERKKEGGLIEMKSKGRYFHVDNQGAEDYDWGS